jgi:hypothetical protein
MGGREKIASCEPNYESIAASVLILRRRVYYRSGVSTAMSPALERNTEVDKESPRKGSSEPEPDVTVKDDVEESIFAKPPHEDIAVLAYSYWVERGQPDGSAEEDWLRAERELTERRQGE